MRFFQPPFTTAAIEARYKDLALVLHPDKGGSKELMQLLNEEKQKALKLVKKMPKRVKVMPSARRRITPPSINHTHININVKDAATFLRELRKWWE